MGFRDERVKLSTAMCILNKEVRWRILNKTVPNRNSYTRKCSSLQNLQILHRMSTLLKHATWQHAEKLVLEHALFRNGIHVLYPSRRKLGTNEKSFVIKSSYWILTCLLLPIKRCWTVMAIIIEFLKRFACFNEVMVIVSSVD